MCSTQRRAGVKIEHLVHKYRASCTYAFATGAKDALEGSTARLERSKFERAQASFEFEGALVRTGRGLERY